MVEHQLISIAVCGTKHVMGNEQVDAVSASEGIKANNKMEGYGFKVACFVGCTAYKKRLI